MSDSDALDKHHQLIEFLERESETGHPDPEETRSCPDDQMAGAGLLMPRSTPIVPSNISDIHANVAGIYRRK